MGDYNKGYRTLTVDLKTYDMLEEICVSQHRKKIDQIRLMVETNHKKIAQEDSVATMKIMMKIRIAFLAI